MMFGKIKRDQADKLFSEYIRKRDRRCVLCNSSVNLTCSHYHSRRKESVRFDVDNCDTFCISCHMKMENEKGFTSGKWHGTFVVLPKKYTAWKMEQLGQKRYDALAARAAKRVKKDRKMELIRIKELMKQLK